MVVLKTLMVVLLVLLMVVGPRPEMLPARRRYLYRMMGSNCSIVHQLVL